MAKGRGKRQTTKKLCCSKKTLTISFAITGALTLTLVLGVFLVPAEVNLTPLEVITGLSWGETGVATGFYYWKAKNEKRLELFERMAEQWADKYGFEAVANLAAALLHD